MPGQATAPKDTAGFLQLSLNVLHEICRRDGGYNEIAAYLVLCTGVNGRQGARYCTHGAQSISKRTGMSYRAAEKAINWLRDTGLILTPPEEGPMFLGKSPSRWTKVRWVLNDAENLDVALSNQFIEGVKGSHKPSPIKRMLADINGTDQIPRGQAVVDAIVLFVALMKEQDFGECAGVDPDAWHHKFLAIADDEDGDGSEHVVPLAGTNGVMVTVKEADDRYAQWPFIHAAFNETPVDEEEKKRLASRFWHAMEQLRALRLVYRVMILWRGDPLDPRQRKKAEPIATQYINDSWARKIDPHLQYEANLAAWRTEARDAYADFTEARETGSIPYVGSGRYRYIVRSDAERNTHLIGQLRVRYWPANQSTVLGRERERNRTEQFSDAISQIGRS